jgi:cell division protein ZipA
VLDLVIIAIVVLAVFAGAIWYAKRSSEQRKALLEDINNIEPEMGDSSQFGDLFQQEVAQQRIDSDRFEVDAEPTVSFSDAVKVAPTTPDSIAEPPAELGDEMPMFNEVIDDDLQLDNIQIDSDNMPEQQQNVMSPDSGSSNKDRAAEEPAQVDEVEMVIAFTVMARGDALFSGKSIKAILESLDLHFGDMQIYHRQVPGLRTQSIFSVANILDPGTLNPDSFATMNTPGLLIFSRLPGPVNGLTLFDDLLDTAQKMADKLDGVLSDEARQPVNQATVEAMRSRILELNMKLQTENNQYENDY